MAESRKAGTARKAPAKKAPAKKPAAKKAPAKKPAAKRTAAKKAPRKTKKTATAKRAKPQLPSLGDALRWGGMPIDGMGGKSLGRIGGIHVDAETGEPRWVLIRLGPLAGSTAIPFEHVAEGAGRLWAAYDRELIRNAPRFRPAESLTALQELELCEHLGIREGQGRAADVAEKDADAITAVPADQRAK